MPDDKGRMVISVGKGDKGQLVKQPGPIVKVQGKTVSTSAGRGVDIVFVIDTTGSMSDKIEGLLSTCSRFVDELSRLALSYRIAVVAFGDLTIPGDEITAFNFSDDVKRVKDTLTGIPRYAGGGNEGESSLEALDKALSLPFRPGAVKAIILLTDEPALQHQSTAQEITRRLRQREVLTFVVSPPEDYFLSMARQNGGTWYQVSADADLTGLLDLFRNLAAKVSTVVADVYRLGNGSVSKYLQIKAPAK
jgi:uncharacterized protein (DUF58 family)